MNYNKRIIISLVFMSTLFLSILAYLTYFEFFMKDSVIVNNYNQRQGEYEDKILRGTIYDRNGTVLAYSDMKKNEQQRIYPYDRLYSHVIGYRNILLEKKYNKYLAGYNELHILVDLKNKLLGQKTKGNDITISIDHELQKQGDKLLNGLTGAIVAMDPKSGEILALVSKPDFDPTEKELAKNFDQLEESTLLPRAIQGLYEPGSTLKVLITAGALENGMENLTFEDEGEITIQGRKISNYGFTSYGTIGIKEALTYSSNVVFSQIAVKLGYEKLNSLTQRAGFNQEISFDLPVKQSQFPYDDHMSVLDMADVGMGQGKIQVTPLHMAMITSSIANDGIMMEPILVKQVQNPSGLSLLKVKQESLGEVMSMQEARKINSMMQEVVEIGTGQQAQIKGIKVAGKTGTAENEMKNKEHAWFVGFAPAENPQIAVAVVIEYSGSTGGQVAAPIAKEMLRYWIK